MCLTQDILDRSALGRHRLRHATTASSHEGLRGKLRASGTCHGRAVELGVLGHDRRFCAAKRAATLPPACDGTRDQAHLLKGIAADLYRRGDPLRHVALEEAAAGEVVRGRARRRRATISGALLLTYAQAEPVDGRHPIQATSLTSIPESGGVNGRLESTRIGHLRPPDTPEDVPRSCPRSTEGQTSSTRTWRHDGLAGTRATTTLRSRAFVPDDYIARVVPRIRGRDMLC